MEDLSTKQFAFQQRVADCKVVYLANHGRHHKEIEREMRALGHERWNRRCLYASRDKSNSRVPGWPERFEWTEGVRRGDGETPRRSDTDPGVSPSCPHRVGSFRAWLKQISPNMTWDWKFQSHIIKKLEKVYSGEIKRLMIFVPPRHGKSELVTVRFSAWWLKHRPKSNIIIGSYNQKLANRFSRKIRNIAAEDAARNADTLDNALPAHDAKTCGNCIKKATECPHAKDASTAETQSRGEGAVDQSSQRLSVSAVNARPRRINTDAEWETPEGGGVRAVGAGAGITGFGADLIVIDDPVKSRAEAESKTIRDNVWHWFNDDLYTRLEPNGSMIIIQTRWHEDDLSGRLLREMYEDEDAEQWEVIDFPALAEPRRPNGERRIENGEFGSGTDEPGNSTGDAPFSALNFPLEEQPFRPRFYTVNGRQIPILPLGGLRPGFEETSTVPQGNPGLPARTGAAAAGSDIEYRDDDLAASGDAGKGARVPGRKGKAPKEWKDELGRKAGAALCPERYDEKRLHRLKRRLGTYSFSALYQQRPIPADGGFFKRHWFKIVDHAPPGIRWRRGYDLGITAKPDADYTATARVGMDSKGDMYIDRVLRRRMEYPEQRRAILALIQQERETEHFIEATANGNAVIQDLRRERSIMGRRFRGVTVKETKIARAITWNALAEEGRVHLVRGAWNKDFIDEACSFPSGAHDDQIDAVSIAVKMCVGHKRSFHEF